MSTEPNREIKLGSNVWHGVDLGRAIADEGNKLRVRFDRHPDGAPASEGLYGADELELAE